jgi:hypothetical protein
MAYTKYSLTPANNTAAPPDGAPEGMLPSAVNDTMRDMMAQIRDVGDGIRDGTYTMTAPKITGGTITGVTYTNIVVTGGSITGITDLAVADGGTGASSITANSVILGNGSSALSGNLVAPGTTGNVLTSNGTTWASQAPASSSFDAGTRLIFAQTTAPTGWTKDTTNYNNHALRVVTGAASTGGSVDFTTAFASGLSAGATTLSTSQMPSHNHTASAVGACGDSTYRFAFTQSNVPQGTMSNLNNTGGGGSHDHTIPSFAVKYLDVITATKN